MPSLSRPNNKWLSIRYSTLVHSLTTPIKANINNRTRIIKEDGEATTIATPTSTTTITISTARARTIKVRAAVVTTTEAVTIRTTRAKAVEVTTIEVAVDHVVEVSPVEEDLRADTTEVVVVAATTRTELEKVLRIHSNVNKNLY